MTVGMLEENQTCRLQKKGKGEEEGREGKSRGKAKTKDRESRDTVSPSKDDEKSLRAAAVDNA